MSYSAATAATYAQNEQDRKDRIAQRAAERKEEKRLNKLTSIAHLCEFFQTAEGQALVVHLDKYGADVESIEFRGSDVLAVANPLLERMGFRPVRLTRNMLNPDSRTIVIDINTPSYCDPGREAYHSM